MLSGSSIADIVNALTFKLFCRQIRQYGQIGWGTLLRQEVPELTAADITGLCDLSEEMEQYELSA